MQVPTQRVSATQPRRFKQCQLIWRSIVYPVRYGLSRGQSRLLGPLLLGMHRLAHDRKDSNLALFQLCLTSRVVYLEFKGYFPSRSGSEVVFLEHAYPNPKWLFPTTFVVQSVILSFGSANANGELVFAFDLASDIR